MSDDFSTSDQVMNEEIFKLEADINEQIFIHLYAFHVTCVLKFILIHCQHYLSLNERSQQYLSYPQCRTTS